MPFKALVALFLAMVCFSPGVSIGGEIEGLKTLPRVVKYNKALMKKANLKCLAQNIFYESGGEAPLGQLAVANVTLNRTKASKHPNNICKIVYEKNQFAWTRDKRRKNIPKDQLTWLDWVAKIAIQTNTYLDNIYGSTYFVTVGTYPKWTHNVERVVRIGGHVFFREIIDE